MALILLQLLLRQSEGCVTHQRRYGNLDPFWARALSMRATTVAVPTSLPQGPRDFLTRRALRLAEACLALISRIAQHRPHRRPFPPRRSPAGWDSAIVQQAGDGIDAQSLLGVRVEYRIRKPVRRRVRSPLRRCSLAQVGRRNPRRVDDQKSNHEIASRDRSRRYLKSREAAQ